MRVARYLKIEIEGIVQGVGLRPFVYRLASEHGIKGTVSNTVEGVVIEACGESGAVDDFVKGLREEAPPQAVIEDLRVSEIKPFSASLFEIISSSGVGEKSVLISPDLATCDDCVRELLDPDDRRYRYPFINCTNCGPRFTIISDTPYDRPLTSMAKFNMCTYCEREYNDPANRRFHAQPNACPACGPRLWLTDSSGEAIEADPVEKAAEFLREGKIVAMKGLGGFHLACDATSDDAVSRLRERKNRYGKPLAIMVRDIDEARRYCEVNAEEERILLSPGRPIVLLREKDGTPLSREVATGLNHQGVFLPYTPLHHMLMSEVGIPLVMTSGNVSSEPIAIGNDEALRHLGGIADYFLLHDRDILVRYDDSVTRVFHGAEYLLRRARGYAPYPILLKHARNVDVLAVGPELKNTFCLLHDEHAFLSQHIGDMETREEVRHFEEALLAISRLFALEPQVVAHDLHPDYLTTQMAMDMALPCIGVQHHHAHIVSCMADNDFDGEVIGVAWDGTGYGADGTVWGGEFLICDERDYRRMAHLFRYPMPGADACIYRLYRMVMGVFSEMYGGPEYALRELEKRFSIDEKEAASIVFQLERGINSPITSSSGRMFDVAAALIGLRGEAVYDGQAACELEAVAKDTQEYYNFKLDRSKEPWVIDTRLVFAEMLADIDAGSDSGEMAGKFHTAMARAIVVTCRELAAETGLNRVVLSGGVFQNEMMTARVMEGLAAAGLEPFAHHRVPCNDGGVSLGQAVVAARTFQSD